MSREFSRAHASNSNRFCAARPRKGRAYIRASPSVHQSSSAAVSTCMLGKWRSAFPSVREAPLCQLLRATRFERARRYLYTAA